MLLKRVLYDKEIENPTEKDIEECTPEARERQWNNKCISERYEPGSVFKIITAASVVEEKAIDLLIKKYKFDHAAGKAPDVCDYNIDVTRDFIKYIFENVEDWTRGMYAC